MKVRPYQKGDIFLGTWRKPVEENLDSYFLRANSFTLTEAGEVVSIISCYPMGRVSVIAVLNSELIDKYPIAVSREVKRALLIHEAYHDTKVMVTEVAPEDAGWAKMFGFKQVGNTNKYIRES